MLKKITQLSYNEREKMYSGFCEHKSQAKIAKELGRHNSTISREKKSNSDDIGSLYPHKAHELAQGRRNQNKVKIDTHNELREYIIHHLKKNGLPM